MNCLDVESSLAQTNYRRCEVTNERAITISGSGMSIRHASYSKGLGFDSGGLFS